MRTLKLVDNCDCKRVIRLRIVCGLKRRMSCKGFREIDIFDYVMFIFQQILVEASVKFSMCSCWKFILFKS